MYVCRWYYQQKVDQVYVKCSIVFCLDFSPIENEYGRASVVTELLNGDQKVVLFLIVGRFHSKFRIGINSLMNVIDN